VLTRPQFAQRRPYNGSIPVDAILSIGLAMALIMTGCTMAERAPDAATKSINVPIRFVDVSGDAIPVNDRPGNSTATLGVIPGAIFGAPLYPLQTEKLGKILALPINLNELRVVLNQQSTTITADAATAGWKIDPADTRFARVSTTITNEGTRPLMIGFVDSVTKNGLLLVFFDRPCRLTGTVLFHARNGEITTFAIDVTVDKAGLNWLKMTDDSDNGHDILTNTRVPSNPLFVVAPVENLKHRLIQAH
jgi:hypothetical protein